MKEQWIGVFCREEPELTAGLQLRFRDKARFRLISREHRQRLSENWPLQNYDALIVRVEDEEDALRLTNAGIPFINVLSTPPPGIFSVSLDDVAMGSLAAQHLNALEVKSYVAVGPLGKQRRWSHERLEGFQTGATRSVLIIDQGNPSQTELLGDPFGPNGGLVKQQFDNLIQTLPEPIGVFTTDQRLGLNYAFLTHQAQKRGHHIYLVGIHDQQDPLTMSVMHCMQRPMREIGEQAGDLLQHMLAHPETPHQQVQIAPQAIRSPVGAQAQNPLAKRAISLIHELADDPNLGIDDLAHLLDVPRRSLERSIRADLDASVLQVIHQLRIERAKDLLEKSDDTISLIAGKVGFGSIDRFMAIFKRYEGVTASEWRKKNP